MSINNLIQVLRVFHRIDSDTTLATFITFCMIKPTGYTHMSEIIKLTGFDKATISRQMTMLSDIGRKEKAGLDLVRLVDDPQDRRYKLVMMTTKGKAIKDAISKLMESTK